MVESRRGRLDQIRGAREALAKANAHLLGVVLNGVPQKTPTDYGRYYDVTPAVAEGGRLVGAGPASEASGPPHVEPR